MKTLYLLPLAILVVFATLICPSGLAQGSTASTQDKPASDEAKPQRRASPSTDFRLIIHPSSSFDEITKSRLSQILLRKSTTWPDGQRAFPIDLEGRSEVRELLTKEIHGRSLATIKSFWQRQIFSGKSVPPPELATDQEVLDFVRRQPGAVGYISPDIPLDGVRELFLLEE